MLDFPAVLTSKGLRHLSVDAIVDFADRLGVPRNRQVDELSRDEAQPLDLLAAVASSTLPSQPQPQRPARKADDSRL